MWQAFFVSCFFRSSLPKRFIHVVLYQELVFLIFFFFFFGCPAHLEFQGQGSDPKCSCDVCHSCGSAGSFNPLYWAGGRTCVLGAAEMQLIPLLHSLLIISFFLFSFFFFFFFFFVFLPFLGLLLWHMGGSQSRGLIGAVAAGLHQSHSNAGSEPHL